MANHPAQTITRAGTTPTYAAAAAGDTVPVGEQVFVHVKNAGSSTTLTVTAVGGSGGLSYEDLEVALPVGETVIGPIVPSLFKNLSDGFAHLAWGSLTSVTFAVLTF